MICGMPGGRQLAVRRCRCSPRFRSACQISYFAWASGRSGGLAAPSDIETLARSSAFHSPLQSGSLAIDAQLRPCGEAAAAGCGAKAATHARSSASAGPA